MAKEKKILGYTKTILSNMSYDELKDLHYDIINEREGLSEMSKRGIELDDLLLLVEEAMKEASENTKKKFLVISVVLWHPKTWERQALKKEGLYVYDMRSWDEGSGNTIEPKVLVNYEGSIVTNFEITDWDIDTEKGKAINDMYGWLDIHDDIEMLCGQEWLDVEAKIKKIIEPFITPDQYRLIERSFSNGDTLVFRVGGRVFITEEDTLKHRKEATIEMVNCSEVDQSCFNADGSYDGDVLPQLYRIILQDPQADVDNVVETLYYDDELISCEPEAN